MKRRNFLKLSLATAAFTMTARAEDARPERAGRGFRVGAQKDHYEEELLIMGGRFDLKVSGRDTGGDLCIYDTFRESKGGPALHRNPCSAFLSAGGQELIDGTRGRIEQSGLSQLRLTGCGGG